MKLSKILSALILSSSISYAVGIEDVKELVLTNSFIIKQNQDAIEIEKQNEELSKTLYQPIISTSYNYSRSDTSSFFSTKESSSFNISLKYNLFNGFSDKYNIESSEIKTEAQKYKTEATIKDIELQASLEYIEILKAKERVKVENKNVTLLLSRLDKTKQFYKNGLLSKDELLKLEVELQNAILQRSNADAALKKTIYKLSNTLSKNLTNESFKDIDENIESFETVDEEIVFQNRSELKYLNSLLASAKKILYAQDSSFYPKIDFSVGYNSYGADATPNGDGLMPDESVGTITLSYELYSGGKTQIQKTKQQRIISSLNSDIEMLKDNIRLSLQNSLENLNTDKIALKLAKKSIEQADEYLRIVTNRFDEQLATNTDVLDASVALLKAQTQLVDAKYNFYKDYLILMRVVGK